MLVTLLPPASAFGGPNARPSGEDVTGRYGTYVEVLYSCLEQANNNVVNSNCISSVLYLLVPARSSKPSTVKREISESRLASPFCFLAPLDCHFSFLCSY